MDDATGMPGTRPPECADEKERHPLTLIKGAHRWTFWCDPGDEQALLRRLSELAGQERTPFDWFDAAVVSHQLSKRLSPGINRADLPSDSLVGLPDGR